MLNDVTHPDFSGGFGSDLTIWYPLSGWRKVYSDDISDTGSLDYVGESGVYWSASPAHYVNAFYLNLYDDYVRLYEDDTNRAVGGSVRCLQE